MTYLDVLKWVGTVLYSVGDGGLIVLGLSNWFGKVWAERLMEKETPRTCPGARGTQGQVRTDPS
jgi:hypothetical protein